MIVLILQCTKNSEVGCSLGIIKSLLFFYLQNLQKIFAHVFETMLTYRVVMEDSFNVHSRDGGQR